MGMQPIVFKVALFRGDYDQARSQFSLLWLLESLCRINQSHIRQFRHMKAAGDIPTAYPLLYRAGVHYEREKGTEEWLDIPHVIAAASGKPEYPPGSWGDCLPVSTLVMTDAGEFVPIGALAPGMNIMSKNGMTTVLEHAITGEKPILGFELGNGSLFRCSPEHRLFRIDGSEVRAEDVKVGDLLATPNEPFGTGESYCPEGVSLSPDELAWMLGVHVADGWTDYPRHPRFCISGRDGKKKEEQKRQVQMIAESHGIETRWHERYIAVNDKPLAKIMSSCGHTAVNKRLPTLSLSRSQVEAAIAGLKADASTAASGTQTIGTISSTLALQVRVLCRMLGQSVHIKRWDEHGGLGENPIYRVVLRTRDDVRQRSARVVAIRELEEELCADITTASGNFWLPESDLIVHNCEDLACWRVAEVRELAEHCVGVGVDGKPVVADPRFSEWYKTIGRNWKRKEGGIKAKPYAKWRLRPDGSYAYHALVMMPDGRLEDPSLTLGMTWEGDFQRLDMAGKYKRKEEPVRIRYADLPDVTVVDPERPSGYGGRSKLEIEMAKAATGLTTLNGDDAVAAYGYDHADVRAEDMAALERELAGHFGMRRSV